MKIDKVKYASTYELINEVRQMRYEGKHTIAKVLIGILKEISCKLAMEIEILKDKPQTTEFSRLLISKVKERNNINEFIAKYEHSRKHNTNAC